MNHDDNELPRQIGRYTILRRIGDGGMSIVYEAHDPTLDKKVALKHLRAECAHDGETLAKFVAEARRIARLDDHDSILNVLECGEFDGRPYITMRLLDGGTLADLLRSGAPLPAERVRSVASAIGGALDYAHANHVVHCDIKPSNILLDRMGRPFLADFGISRLVADVLAGDEAQPSVYTPKYASPEQVREQPPDERSDIYSLAVVLYQMCVGATPYGRVDDLEELRRRILEELPKPPSAINPSVPAELDAVLLRALDKDPARRPQSAGELVRGVLKALASRPAAAAIVAQSESDDELSRTAPPRRSAAAARAPAPREKSGVGAVIAIVGTGLLLVGGVTFAASIWNRDDGTVLRPEPRDDDVPDEKLPGLPTDPEHAVRIVYDASGVQPELATAIERFVAQMASRLGARAGFAVLETAPNNFETAPSTEQIAELAAERGADSIVVVRVRGGIESVPLRGTVRYRIDWGAFDLWVGGVDAQQSAERNVPDATVSKSKRDLSPSIDAAIERALDAVGPATHDWVEAQLERRARAPNRAFLLTVHDPSGTATGLGDSLRSALAAATKSEVVCVAGDEPWRLVVRFGGDPEEFARTVRRVVSATLGARAGTLAPSIEFGPNARQLVVTLGG